MMMRTRFRAVLGLAAMGLLTTAGSAQAAFLGLEVGDLIETMGFSIPAASASYTDSNNHLDIDALANDITTTTPAVLTEINGGDINILLDVASESLTSLGGTFFQYEAVFTGRTGATDVEIFAPTGGPNPEQDGRLLVAGDVLINGTDDPKLTIVFDSSGAFTPTFTAQGTFIVDGSGDATFQQAFGSMGDLAQLIIASNSTSPALSSLLSDGYLFSVRDVNLATCAGGGDCVGSVIGSQDWTGAGTGEFIPQNAAPFVPEPGTFLMMNLGLLGLAAARRSASRR